MMKVIKGDLLQLAEQGEFDIIVHDCNCFNAMGAGIAKQIKDKYPLAYESDCRTKRGDEFKLGKFSTANVGKFQIVNAYTQFRTASFKGEVVFNYNAFLKILVTLFEVYPAETRFGFPLIGCGLAGADKDRIVGMLNLFATNRDVTLVEFS